jgi:hypothetical protein
LLRLLAFHKGNANNYMSKTRITVRRSAQILSVLILLFWGYFIVAHLLGNGGHSSRPLTTGDYCLISMMSLWLVGLAVAWWRELVGAAIALLALSIEAMINPHAITGLGSLPLVTALLFLISWGLSKAPVHDVT